MAEDSGAVLPTYFLLLPPPPSTPDSLHAAYAEPLTATLKQVSDAIRKATAGASLDIVLPVPFFAASERRSRSSLYKRVQVLVAGLYKLIGIIAIQCDVNIEDKEGINARVILLSHSTEQKEEESANQAKSAANLQWGPVVELETLARSERPWQVVFSVESEEGEAILRTFLKLKDSHTVISRVKGGVVQVRNDLTSQDDSTTYDDEHHISVIVGGTWDHLHLGHKLLLTMTAFLLDTSESRAQDGLKLTVGISGDQILQKKQDRDYLETWKEREGAVVSFLRAIMDFRPPKHANVTLKQTTGATQVWDVQLDGLTFHLSELEEMYGPTITDEGVTALVVSGETRSGGQAVNKKRAEKGWHEVHVFEVDVLAAGTEGDDESEESILKSKISSTSIRRGIREKGEGRTAR